MNGLRISIALIALFSAVVASAQITIGDLLYNNGSFFSRNDNSDHRVWGQTIQTPDASHVELSAFSLAYGSQYGDVVDFRAYVYEWGGLNLNGSALYSSAVQNVAVTQDTFTFSPAGLVLDASKTYILFIEALRAADTRGLAYINTTPSHLATSGTIFQGVGFIDDPISNLVWSNYTSSGDLSFSATFNEVVITPVPESSTAAAVFGAGLVSVLVVLRVRKKRRDVAAVAAA